MNNKIKMILSSISPNLTTRLMYFYNFHKVLNLNNPKDINEKLQYLKLKTYYNNPIVTKCVDKYAVRSYLEEKGFSKLLPKFIDCGVNANQIRDNWNKYPNKFVVKCNHGCGYNILVDDKNKFDVENVVKQIDQWLKEDFWKIYCEPQYKFIEKRFLVEEYLADDIKTYKFYCFNGVPEVCYISSNGENGEKDLYLDYFDMNWNHLPISLHGHEHDKRPIDRPTSLDEMIKLSKELSKDFPFVRVDLYDVEGKVYFSELTFIPTGGNMKLTPKSIISEWGDKLTL